jgi:photosystem II stability/assembly factor-like uncharacterized protein
MKSVVTTFLLLFLLAFIATGHAQNNIWINQTSPDAGPDLNGIQTINDHTAYAVGDSTTFAIFSDNNSIYQRHISLYTNSNRDSPLTALSFLNLKTGVVVGSFQALKTINGGSTWDSLSIPSYALCKGVLMISKDIIIIVGANNLLIRSTDGGKTWKQYGFIEQGIGSLTSIKKIREDFIVITASSSYLLFSSDSGKTWTTQKNIYDNTIYSVDFDNDTDGVAVGEGGYIIQTSDRGITWSQHVIDTGYIAQVILRGIERTTSRNYVACGEYNLIMYSSDNGIHWTQATKDAWATNISFNGLSMLDDRVGYACGSFGFAIKTTDGGFSWKFLPKTPLTNELYSIAYPKGDTLNGISVGETRTIMRTIDGGKNWVNATDPAIAEGVWIDLNSVTFSSPSTAILVGDKGTIAKSIDGGITWKKLPKIVEQDLYSVFFLDPMIGWASGDSGTVLKTTNGGDSWNILSLPLSSTENYYSVSFCDDQNGLAGTHRTTDGGKTWLEPTIYLEGRFKASIMLSPQHYCISMQILDGWNNPVIGKLRTFIGDSIYLLNATYTQFLDIAFGDSVHGTTVGQYRTTGSNGGAIITPIIYQTTDGGKTWKNQKNAGFQGNYGVTMPTPLIASACGIKAKIQRRSNTPEVSSVADHSPATNSPLQILSLYPNPAHDESTLRVYVDRPVEAELRIINMLGVMVKQIDLGIQYEGERDIPIPLEMLSAGKYIVELRSGESVKHLVVGVQ